LFTAALFDILKASIYFNGRSSNGFVFYTARASGLKAGALIMLSIIGIAPHPPIIIPEIGRDRLSEAKQTVDGMKLLSSRIKETAPELLIVITPHGQIVPEGPVVLTQEQLTGDFGQFGFPDIIINTQTDRQLIDLLVEEATSGPVRPVLLDDTGHNLRRGRVLDHGAMVPLYYLYEAGVKVPCVHITISFQPYRQLYQFGRVLRKAVERRGAPTAVVTSGDLSHRLTRGAPAGFNPHGAEFDRLLVRFLREGRVEDILEFDQQLVEEAGECGLRSFVIGLGMLDGENFQPEIISYEGPFGVGYLVAALHPDRNTNIASGETEVY